MTHASDQHNSLVSALLRLENSIGNYVEDAEQSGCHEYSLHVLVPIPMDEPTDMELDNHCWLAWLVKRAVISVENAYKRVSGRDILPKEGLSLWKILLAESRTQTSAKDIYIAAEKFRHWVRTEVDELTSSGDEPSTNEVFKKFGEYWRLTFNGDTVYMRDSVGIAYIARLLNEPNRDLPAVSLLAARAGIDSRILSGSAGEVLDAAGRETFGKRYRELSEELEEARENNDLGLIEKLKGEQDNLAEQLDKAIGLGGRSREKTDADRVRKSVSMAVSRDIERIAGEHAALGRHLMAAISSGYTFRYAPEQALHWLT